MHDLIFTFDLVSLLSSLLWKRQWEQWWNTKTRGVQMEMSSMIELICRKKYPLSNVKRPYVPTSLRLLNHWDRISQVVGCQMLQFQCPLQVQSFLQKRRAWSINYWQRHRKNTGTLTSNFSSCGCVLDSKKIHKQTQCSIITTDLPYSTPELITGRFSIFIRSNLHEQIQRISTINLPWKRIHDLKLCITRSNAS